MASSEYERRHRAKVEELESELTGERLAIIDLTQMGCLEAARQRARALTAPDRPAEFRMTGYLYCGLVEGELGDPEKALVCLEESRRIAVNLEDYTHAAHTQQMVCEIAGDWDSAAAEQARKLGAYYRAYRNEASQRGVPAPERFRSFEIGYD